MEERKLRTHLMRIYCIAVAAVLLAAIVAVALLFRRDAAANNRETFSTLLFAMSDQLRAGDPVSHPQLRSLEQKNRLLLSLRDNGAPLFYNSGDDSERTALFAQTERWAAEDGYDVSLLPLTTERRTSPIYAFFQGNASYLGAVSILPMEDGYRALTMVQRVTTLGTGRAVLLAAGYLVSLALLCAVGVRLIDRALAPAVESRKRQTQFIAAASHELRSPLAVIAANACSLREQTDASREASAAIEAECGRMSRLIGDMLLLASTDAKSWPVALTPVEADTVLLNVYEAWSPLLLRQGCTLVLTLPEAPLPRIMADAERLSQVLDILLDNALSYGMTAERKTAELAAEPCGRGVAITVRDHGAGLTDEQKTRVFDRFYRADASRRDKQHFGLGLSIAKELTSLQNGRLTAEDTPGGGCTFRIVF